MVAGEEIKRAREGEGGGGAWMRVVGGKGTEEDAGGEGGFQGEAVSNTERVRERGERVPHRGMLQGLGESRTLGEQQSTPQLL